MKKAKFLYLIIIALCTSCVMFEKPGEGNTAIYGYKSMYILQDEIYKYRLKNNHFPPDLTFLSKIEIPIDYKPAGDSALHLTGMEGRRCTIEYRNFGEYFQLEFIYWPPGMNKMKYDSVNKQWLIRGHF